MVRVRVEFTDGQKETYGNAEIDYSCMAVIVRGGKGFEYKVIPFEQVKAVLELSDE